MKKLLVFLLFISPVLLRAQDTGIKFEKNLSWEAIKAKAKAENKFIFVDCFATWCGPCKAMDKDVYPDEKVGDYVNDKFISVKLQFDKTEQDNNEVKIWYAVASEIEHEYKVTAYPTYLFFSPDGSILHRAVGFKNARDFIAVANEATKTNKQYYSLIENYQHGTKDYSVMPYLATTAKDLKEKDLANKIARDYFDNYLFKSPEEELYSKKNLEFIYAFDNILTTKDKGFDLFYRHGTQVDAILGSTSGLSQFITDYVITREEIDPIIDNAIKGSPDLDWNKVAERLKDKYGADYADRIVPISRIRFYEKTENWKPYLKYAIIKVEKAGVDTINIWHTVDMDNTAWMIFLHSNDRQQIDTAIRWMQKLMMTTSITSQPGWIDTYANLLYKSGKKEEALALEAIALRIAQKNAAEYKQDPDEVYQKTVDKMKSGKPTWE